MTEPTITTLPDGTIEYRNADDQRHRADGPAVTTSDGYQAWYLNGKCHRADGPAVTTSDGYQQWWRNYQLHRADGPAVTAPDGLQEWYLNGKRMTQAEHAEAVAKIRSGK